MKEFIAQDTCGKSRLFIESNCSVCTNLYTRQKRWLNPENTCSQKCGNVLKGVTILCTCGHCKANFYRAKSKVKASKSGIIFCSRKCKDSAQKYMVEIQPNHYGTVEKNYRKLAFRNYKPLCNMCGYSNIDALEVHHKDRNRANNKIANLEILCSNCHSIEHKSGH